MLTIVHYTFLVSFSEFFSSTDVTLSRSQDPFSKLSSYFILGLKKILTPPPDLTPQNGADDSSSLCV